MKKLLSALFVLLMAFSLSAPVLASEAAPIYQVDASAEKPLELTLIGQERTAHGRVDVYSFHLPDDGTFYELPDFCGTYEDGSRVTVEGTWNPTYGRLQVLLKELEFGSSVYSYVACNEPTVYGLWHSSAWSCFLKADGRPLSGTLRVEVA